MVNSNGEIRRKKLILGLRVKRILTPKYVQTLFLQGVLPERWTSLSFREPTERRSKIVNRLLCKV